MDVETIRQKLQKLVDKVNNIAASEVIFFHDTQKNKTNVAIRRIDDSIDPLWINICKSDFRVGYHVSNQKIKKLIDIFKNHDLEKMPFNGKVNRQNIKHKCSSDKIEQVIYEYAEIKKECMPISKWNSKDEKGKGSTEDNMNTPLNQILYGPPGTGKTYSTVEKALEILEPNLSENEREALNIKSIKQLQDKYGSQIEFVTFHQSFSYEDFVEGIKAEDNGERLTYEPKPGIFKTICANAEDNYTNANSKEKDLIVRHEFDVKLEKLKEEIDDSIEKGEKFALTDYVYIDSYTDQVFKYTGDNWKHVSRVSFDNLFKIYQAGCTERKDIKTVKDINSLTKVHATYSFAIHNKIKDIQIDSALSIQEKEKLKKYVLIIDEINRGNISRIFGELITLIEPSKRIGNDEPLEVQLPYSKEPFGVPSNLHIIGTMNTADRSLANIDIALRRRFRFEEMPPDYELEKINRTVDGIDLSELLKAINYRICQLLDREHQIGHSFFMRVTDFPNLKEVFQYEILPLLEEYFFDDWDKIKQVLNDTKTHAFYSQSDFGDYTISDADNTLFERGDISKLNKKYFIHIYHTEPKLADNQNDNQDNLNDN